MEHCFICKKTLNEGKVITVQRKRIERLIKASVIRGEKEHEHMLTPLTSLRVHAPCQIQYGDERAAEAAVRRRLSSQSSSSSRSSTPLPVPEDEAFDFEHRCFICTEVIPENIEEINKTLRYNKRIRINIVRSFSEVKKAILSKIKDRLDEFSLAIVARIEDVSDVAGAGAKYHRKCLLKLSNEPKRGTKRGRACEGVDDVVSAIYNYMVNNDNDCQFKLSDIINEINGAETIDIRTIKKNLLDKYRDNITMYDKSRTGTIICLRNTGAKILSESFYRRKKGNTEEEKLRVVEEAAGIILEDIRSLLLQDEYPPIDDFMKDTHSIIPKSLTVFLHTLILRYKRSTTDKWEKICTSIAHAIITAVRPRRFHSPLQLGISALLYRKFSSRYLIDTLSAFGFCSSYTEVLLFESCCIQNHSPRISLDGFSQFVFDNSDFNVNTIDGHNTFHAMGGIQCVTPADSVNYNQCASRKSTKLTAEEIANFGRIPIETYEKHSNPNPLCALDINSVRPINLTISPTLADFLWLYGKWAVRPDIPGWNGFMQQVTGKFDEVSEQEETLPTAFSSMSTVKDSHYLTQKESGHEIHDMEIEKSVLGTLLEQSGIHKMAGKDRQYVLISSPTKTVKKITQLLSSGCISKDSVIKELQCSLEHVDNIITYLNPTIIDDQEAHVGFHKNVSLARILIQVPLLQSAILSRLLRRFTEELISSDSIEDIPWAYTLLPQLQYPEFVADPDSMTIALTELLDNAPNWFKSEIITYLPDIVVESHHERFANILCTMIESDPQLIGAILNCLTNFTLDDKYIEELRDKVLAILNRTNKLSKIPGLVKFALHDCPTNEISLKVLRAIRELDMRPIRGTNHDEYYKCQLQTVNAMKITLKSTSQAVVKLLSESPDSNPLPYDLIMLHLLCRDERGKKEAFTILRKHIDSGYYTLSLLNRFYSEFKLVAQDFHAISLHLSSKLLKSEDCTLINFSIEWFRCQFVLHNQLFHRQNEIIQKLILLMGKSDQTAKDSLNVLLKITERQEDKLQLQKHSNDFIVLMEKIENFDPDTAGAFSDLLYAMCNTSDSSSENLREHLLILLQKQLANIDPVIKSKGVISGVMAIKHLAQENNFDKLVYQLIQKIEVSVENCASSRALFYDKMSEMININESIQYEFITNLRESFYNKFCDKYQAHKNYKGNLVPMNRLEHEGNQEQVTVDFGESKYGALAPALFRLVGISTRRINAGNSLEAVAHLLPCSIMMPTNMIGDMPRTFDLLFHRVNWLRELINAFATQSDNLTRNHVVQRLDDLIDLQEELCHMLETAESTYQPPQCYFNKLTPPKFIRVVEKKKVKSRGKQTSQDDDANTLGSEGERATWNNGTLMTMKNSMYFRKFDPIIVNLLDPDTSKELSPRQVSFIINEVIFMLDKSPDANYLFMNNLIKFLPKICARLNEIVAVLRSHPNDEDNRSFHLLLTLLSRVFDWKGFKAKNNLSTLTNALRTLASQMEPSKEAPICKAELINECHLYLESFCDVITDISIAHALISLCNILMNHNATHEQVQHDRLANMAHGFLSLNWIVSKTIPKSIVSGLLKKWLDNQSDPLQTVYQVLQWLPEEAEQLEKPQDKLITLPAIHMKNFHCFFEKLFDLLIQGCKISVESAADDVAKLQVWKQVADDIQLMAKVCKRVRTRKVLSCYLRQIPKLLKLIMQMALPLLEKDSRYHKEDVVHILRMIQTGTRHLNKVCVHCVQAKYTSLTGLIPTARASLEEFLFKIKGMMVMNKIPAAFSMGSLINKNLDGEEILSQEATSSDESTGPEGEVEYDESSDDESLTEGQ